MSMNRLWNVSNPAQGNYKRVLCVCSAGLLRSPTTAWVLSQEPYGYNTRAAGLEADYALIPVDQILVTWANEIVCMNSEQVEQLSSRFQIGDRIIVNLNIPDSFNYRDPQLVKLIHAGYDAFFQATVK